MFSRRGFFLKKLSSSAQSPDAILSQFIDTDSYSPATRHHDESIIKSSIRFRNILSVVQDVGKLLGMMS